MIILAVNDAAGRTIVVLSPITHTPPTVPSHGVEIPEQTRRRLGLDDAPCWVITNDLNQFIWPGYDLRPIPGSDPQSVAYGFVPAKLYDRIKTEIFAHVKAGAAPTKRD